ncbi:MAG TPA: VTT domain-containing protein [Candidatus Angelobacter sp.]|nr:VTT domain-containing protein [Candidatus Angelobacter sp.]
MFTRSKLLLKYTAWVAALKSLGAWGVFIIAGLDAAAFGIPMDPLVAGFVYANPHKAWIYCLAAALGSALGSLIPYGLGRAGGELFLLKRIDQAKLERIRDRFEKREFLAIMIPAMLPPPTPFKLLVFSAGVFEMKVRQFVLATILGRLLRFGILSGLTIIFGQQIVDLTKDLVRKHPWVATAIGVVILGVLYLIYRMFREPAAEVIHEIETEKHAGDSQKPLTRSEPL